MQRQTRDVSLEQFFPNYNSSFRVTLKMLRPTIVLTQSSPKPSSLAVAWIAVLLHVCRLRCLLQNNSTMRPSPPTHPSSQPSPQHPQPPPPPHSQMMTGQVSLIQHIHSHSWRITCSAVSSHHIMVTENRNCHRRDCFLRDIRLYRWYIIAQVLWNDIYFNVEFMIYNKLLTRIVCQKAP